MNTNNIEARYGKIKMNTIALMIEQNKCVMADGTVQSAFKFFLPDGRIIDGFYKSHNEDWSIEWFLTVPNEDDELFGTVRLSKKEYPIRAVDNYGNIIGEIRGDDRRECIKKDLQTFLLDNKYKIAVI